MVAKLDPNPNPNSNPNQRETPGGKPVLVSPEEYAAITHLPLQYIRHLCSKACEKWRCASRFDERDLKRFSKSKVLIWYMPRNPMTGLDFPRVIERPNDPPKADWLKKEKAPEQPPAQDGLD